ncbi:hypothetical protein B484DRAFT_440531, partial [Ochromonadaceae sp. CCMP2298]
MVQSSAGLVIFEAGSANASGNTFQWRTNGTGGPRTCMELDTSGNLNVIGNITGPTITSINTSIATKLNTINPVITGGLTTTSGSSGGIFSSSDTANRETGLYVRMFQAANNRAIFVIGGSGNQFEWRKDTTILMNLDENANLSVGGNITLSGASSIISQTRLTGATNSLGGTIFTDQLTLSGGTSRIVQQESFTGINSLGKTDFTGDIRMTGTTTTCQLSNLTVSGLTVSGVIAGITKSSVSL